MLTPADLAEALARLDSEEGVSLPFLCPTEGERLAAAGEDLPYRLARPILGTPGKEVCQDFELTVAIPENSVFHDLASALETELDAAMALLPNPPLASLPPLNDLILQRYETTSKGITPHRDHIRYRGLVALVTLVGEARFFVCEDRSGAGAREVPMGPGSLVLLRAPGFAGREGRPFHYLDRVKKRRVSLGLRHDTRPDL